MLKAHVISNGIMELEDFFPSDDRIQYRITPVEKDFKIDLNDADLLIVPNGSDHVAMAKIKHQVQDFLNAGGALFCFDGWFTDWVPGNQWIMDNSKLTKDIRYKVKTDRHGLLDGVNIDDFIFSHGISGWWSCGYIDANPAADVLMEDTWGRAIVVLDEVATRGTTLLTASGPIPAFDADKNRDSGLTRLYEAALERVRKKSQRREGVMS